MQLSDLGRKPIRADSPAGDDVQLDPRFEALESEIGKIASPTAAAGVDWPRAAQLAEEILEQKSKHLLVAGYLSVALLKTEGLTGLEQSAHVMRDMLENFWEVLYPPKRRMRGRKSAIEWWVEKVVASLAGITPEKWPNVRREIFLEDLNAVDYFLGQNMEDAPVLGALLQAVGGKIETEPEPGPAPPKPVAGPAPPPPPPQAASTPSKPAPTPPPGRPAAPAAAGPADTDPARLLEQGLALLDRASGILMQQNPCQARVFLLNRLVAWLPVDELPPATAGKTMIPPPDGQVVAAMDNLCRAADWAGLLAAAESRVVQYLFWLDLSRYAAEALAGLGHPETSRRVAAETLQYVQRLPGIERLGFSDGTPFANPDTLAWLAELARQSGPGDGGDAGSRAGQEIQTALAEAQQLIRDNKLGQALDGFHDRMNHAVSGRTRCLWEISLCRLLFQARKPRLAAPYLKELLALLDRHQVEQYEPELAVEALTVILTGLRLQEENKDEALIEKVINRISWLSPARALDFV